MGGSHLFGLSIPGVELHVALVGIVYVRLILCANYLVIEGDSSTVIRWILYYESGSATHPLLQDIFSLLRGVARFFIQYVYWKANLTIN